MCIGWFLSPKPTIQWWKDGFSICHGCWDTALCLFWGHAPIITTISGLRGNGWNLAIILFFFSCQVWNRNNRPARFRDFSILYNVDRPTHLSPWLHQNFRNGLHNWCVKFRADGCNRKPPRAVLIWRLSWKLKIPEAWMMHTFGRAAKHIICQNSS